MKFALGKTGIGLLATNATLYSGLYQKGIGSRFRIYLQWSAPMPTVRKSDGKYLFLESWQYSARTKVDE